MVVCEPYFEQIPDIRRAVPGTIIIGRSYGSGIIDAWDPPFDDLPRLEAFGRRVGELSEGRQFGDQAPRYAFDIAQVLNEPSIEGNLAPDPPGFTRLARAFEAIARGFRATSSKRLGTIPLAPGNREDDYGDWHYRGADYLRDAWDLADVLILHNYWNSPELRESQWEGRRYRLQLDAYGWTRDWAIAECNRPHLNDPEDLRLWAAGLPDDPRFLGACWFLLDSQDPGHAAYSLRDRPGLKSVITQLNNAPREKPTLQIRFDPIAPASPGQPHTIRLRTTDDAGNLVPLVGMVSFIVSLPRKSSDYAYAVDPFTWDSDIGGPDLDGIFEASYQFPDMPEFTGEAGASVHAVFINPDPAVPEMAADAQFIVRSSPVDPPSPPAPVQPQPLASALSGNYDLIWNHAGDIVNAAEPIPDPEIAGLALEIHKAIVRRKAGLAPFAPGRPR